MAKEVIQRIYSLNCESTLTLGIVRGNINSCGDKEFTRGKMQAALVNC